jgi:hypothetical protein
MKVGRRGNATREGEVVRKGRDRKRVKTSERRILSVMKFSRLVTITETAVRRF